MPTWRSASPGTGSRSSTKHWTKSAPAITRSWSGTVWKRSTAGRASSRPSTPASRPCWRNGRGTWRISSLLPAPVVSPRRPSSPRPGGGIAGFASARNLASWTGVCPWQNGSAGVNRSGRTRPGNKDLKRLQGPPRWPPSEEGSLPRLLLLDRTTLLGPCPETSGTSVVLDHDPNVVGLAGRPVRLLWHDEQRRVRSWAAQIFARRADGTALLADCPSHAATGGERALKAAAGMTRACEQVGWTYRAPRTTRTGAGGQPAVARQLPAPPQPGPPRSHRRRAGSLRVPAAAVGSLHPIHPTSRHHRHPRRNEHITKATLDAVRLDHHAAPPKRPRRSLSNNLQHPNSTTTPQPQPLSPPATAFQPSHPSRSAMAQA
ncbi:transposase [Streptomyces vinaceus]